MAYRIEIERPAEKVLAKLSHATATRIARAIQSLAADPRPAGSKKLVGSDQWRIRVGDYRIIYRIHDEILTIRVVKLGHRREIYR